MDFRVPTLYLGVQLGGTCWWLPRISKTKPEPGKKSWGVVIGWLLLGVHVYLNRHDDNIQ